MNRIFIWTIFSASIFTPVIASSSSLHQIATEAIPTEATEAVHCHGDNGSISSDDRISKLELKIAEQEKKLDRFETTANEDRKAIHHLRMRVEILEASDGACNVTRINKKPLDGRRKRPARLLPNTFLYGKPKNASDDAEEKRFYGPPANCSDLKKLGYTLNGYYLVKGSDVSSKGKIKVIFCRFKQPLSGEKLRFETLIGYVNLRTTSVHFYVQRLAYLKKNGTIPFNMARLNVGGAMNLTTGVFRCPVKGIYHFEFSSLKDNNALSDSYVHLYLNGNVMIGSSYANKGVPYLGHSGISASLRLKAGDTISLTKTSGVLNDHKDAGYPLQFTHFTGWLVEEELDLK